jgi:hypothetical protein
MGIIALVYSNEKADFLGSVLFTGTGSSFQGREGNRALKSGDRWARSQKSGFR